MKVGTKSLLFGVHQFLWHPYTVLRAWVQLYGWPKWWELVAICLHDVGYYGKPNMDGTEGQRHPEGGAKLTEKTVRRLARVRIYLDHPFKSLFDPVFQMFSVMAVEDTAKAAFDTAIGHSRFYSEKYGVPLSKLFRADKLSLNYDPKWFYVVRSRLSGEVKEYMRNAHMRFRNPSRWFDWYKQYVNKKFGIEI